MFPWKHLYFKEHGMEISDMYRHVLPKMKEGVLLL